MITVTRINDKEITLNADLIEYAESTPDTIVTLSTGKKYIIKESIQEVIDKVLEYRRQIFPFKQFRKSVEV
jgi:flagellar protein FlbD